MRLARFTVGNGERQVALGRGIAEHRLNVRRVAVDIRDHHDDVARRQRRILRQHGQQLIVQHLHFPLRAVAGMQAEGAVVLIQRTFAEAAFQRFRGNTDHRMVFQLQHVALNGVQHGIGRDIDKGVNLLRPFHLRQQIEVIAPQLAPRGQQRVAELLLAFGVKQARRVIRLAEQPVLACLMVVTALAALQAGQESVILNIAPIVATGVGEHQVDIYMPPQRLQRLQIDRRQRRDTADKHPRRQTGRAGFCLLQRVDKSAVQIGAVPFRLPQLARVLHQPRPERRLPLLSLRQAVDALTALPALQPLRAINQILVEQVGDPAGQLVNLALVTVIGQIVLQWRKRRLSQHLRQQPHQLPGHGVLAEGALFRDIRQHPGEHVPNKGRRQRKRNIGGDAELFRQLHLQPLRHTGALHQHHFRLKRIGQRISGYQRAGQRFQQIQLIGMINREHQGSFKTKDIPA
ncbi:Uncharacterised protein [Serratia marcescens]|nr:Uncharacterised protein [Serratia marcescens]